MYPNIKNTIVGLDNWVSLTKGIDLNEMIFNHIDGKPRRYIIVRKKIEDRRKASGKLLFDDLPGYRFSCYLTNLDLPLDQIWNIYNTRADFENRIKELKQDFGLDNFCLQDFWVDVGGLSICGGTWSKTMVFQSYWGKTIKRYIGPRYF